MPAEKVMAYMFSDFFLILKLFFYLTVNFSLVSHNLVDQSSPILSIGKQNASTKNESMSPVLPILPLKLVVMATSLEDAK